MVGHGSCHISRLFLSFLKWREGGGEQAASISPSVQCQITQRFPRSVFILAHGTRCNNAGLCESGLDHECEVTNLIYTAVTFVLKLKILLLEDYICENAVHYTSDI